MRPMESKRNPWRLATPRMSETPPPPLSCPSSSYLYYNPSISSPRAEILKPYPSPLRVFLRASATLRSVLIPIDSTAPLVVAKRSTAAPRPSVPHLWPTPLPPSPQPFLNSPHPMQPRPSNSPSIFHFPANLHKTKFYPNIPLPLRYNPPDDQPGAGRSPPAVLM
jgi:hypothetical protein